MTLTQLPVLGAPKKPHAPLRKIAIEEHFMNPDATNPGGAFVPEAFAKVSGLEGEFVKIVMQRMNDLHNKRVEEMDAAGIDVSILSLTAAGIEGIADAEKATVAARKVNDALAETIERSKGRFLGFASLPLQDPDAAIKELEYAIGNLGFKGVMVNGYVQDPDENIGHYLDEAQFIPVWDAIADLKVPVYIHPRPSLPQVRSALYDRHAELAGATWGFAPETATHALRLVYSGLFDRHPDVTVILGHLGETLPYFSWRIQRCFEFNPLGHQVNKRLQDYLCENFYITTSGNNFDQALICAILTIGADRIMFATDYPFEMSDDAARWLERAPISENDRRKIAHKNAQGLFGL
ncbi:amidohydrolase family protein [Burkholderia multivorans]|uniref:amidohydrolase family protein n=1 Tax=Burkholderia multivorans TaxID=87883 RepID=UPI001C24162D|nr:amidohydrolase family protein [Burkholderia multivorans]MBU9212386.1 amidohydrolase family protein [Burkholderia multivorans]